MIARSIEQCRQGNQGGGDIVHRRPAIRSYPGAGTSGKSNTDSHPCEEYMVRAERPAAGLFVSPGASCRNGFDFRNALVAFSVKFDTSGKSPGAMASLQKSRQRHSPICRRAKRMSPSGTASFLIAALPQSMEFHCSRPHLMRRIVHSTLSRR